MTTEVKIENRGPGDVEVTFVDLRTMKVQQADPIYLRPRAYVKGLIYDTQQVVVSEVARKG